jgi:hypothetical protein
MLATLGVVALIYLGVPRDDSSLIQRIDYVSVSQEAEASLGLEVIAPQIPASWWSNAARVEKQLGLDAWYVGFVTADNEFLGLNQTFSSNPSWEADFLAGNQLSSSELVGGLSWELYPTKMPSDPPGTKEFAMLHRAENFTVVIYGTAEKADFLLLAEAISKQLGN